MSQKVANNPLGSYPVDVDRTATGDTRQAVAIDIGEVVGDAYTPSRVSASNPMPTSISGTIPLPTDAATATNQTVQNANLVTLTDASSLDGFSSGNRVNHMGIYDPFLPGWVAWNGGLIQSGNWSVRTQDGAGNALTSSTSAPSGSERGLHVRQVGAASSSIEAPEITTGSITTVVDNVTVALAGRQSVMLQIAGTYSLFNGTFELSIDNGANYHVVQGCLLNANTIVTATGSLSSTLRAYEFSVNGATHFRLRRTALSSGTVNVTVSASYFGTEPVPAIPTHAVTLASTTITSVVPTTGATALGKAIDAVPGATDTGVAALMQRVDSPATLTPINGDYALPRLDSLGRQWVAAVQSGTWSSQFADGNGDKIFFTADDFWGTGFRGIMAGAYDFTASQWGPIPLSNSGTTVPVEVPSEVSAVTRVSAITWGAVTRTTVAAVAATAMAANANRRALSLWNESGGAMYWTFNGTASLTNYQGILYSGDGIIFKGDDNSTQALSVITAAATVTYTVSEAT